MHFPPMLGRIVVQQASHPPLVGPLQLTNQTFSSFLGSKNQHRLTRQGEVAVETAVLPGTVEETPPPHRQNQQDRV